MSEFNVLQQEKKIESAISIKMLNLYELKLLNINTGVTSEVSDLHKKQTNNKVPSAGLSVL